jgi:Fur family ferric uptake transcriptional regulator
VQHSDLKKAGLRATAPRVRILEILEQGGKRHLSAEDIYRQLLALGEEIGLATVYRVLTQFENAGLVTRHNFEGGHRLQREIAEAQGYDLVHHSLVLYVRPVKKD